MAHVQRLQEALDDLTAHPEKHNQATWFSTSDRVYEDRKPDLRVVKADCNSVMCLAGDVAVNNGYTFVVRPNSNVAEEVISNDLIDRMLAGDQDAMEEIRMAERVGAELLELDDDEAQWLFGSDNSIVDLWAMAWVLTEGQIKLPEKLRVTHHDWLYHNVGPAAAELGEATIYNVPRQVLNFCHDNDWHVSGQITGDMLEALSDQADQRDVQIRTDIKLRTS